MNTFKRAVGRMAMPVILALVLAVVFAASASATAVNLRVESPNGTIFNGVVNTGPRSVNNLAGNCNGAASSVAINKATTATALADMVDTLGAGAPAFATGYGGGYICQIGSFVEAYPNGSWFLKINNLDSPPPNGYVTASDQLSDGDSVLVYYSAGNPTSTLDFKLPSSAKPGDVLSGQVNSWAINNNDAKTSAAGVTVSGGGQTTTTAADGSFSISFPAAGSYLVTASRAGSIRGSEWVTIDQAAVTPAPIVKINRFLKCSDTYDKGTKKYTRCIRIVRAKQVAEKKKQK